jgi:hypothetical protein
MATTRDPLTPSCASAALDVLLSLDGDPHADAVRERFHRTHLHKLRRGERKPDADTAFQIETLTQGRVPAVGWGSFDAKTIDAMRRQTANETVPPRAS